RRRAGMPGEGAGGRTLTVAGYSEAKAERLDWAAATPLGRARGNRTGIDPTTQEQPERHITGELLTDRSLELLPERLRPLVPVNRNVRGERQIPVRTDAGLAPRAHGQQMAWRELVDPGEDRVGRRNGLEAQLAA